MITAYHRPQNLEEALKLIARPTPKTIPLGGGTSVSHGQEESVEVVDLQLLGLNRIRRQGNKLEIGATATLQQMLEHDDCPPAMKPALKLEAPINLRNAASVAGTLVACDGRSGFAAALLALDASIKLQDSGAQTLSLGEFLPIRDRLLPHRLITSLTMPLNTRLAFDYVSRTPADKPIVCVAFAKWPSGRTRLTVGGHGPVPLLAMDGTEAEGLETAARNAMHDASDPWGSAEYRMEAAAILARRCMELINA